MGTAVGRCFERFCCLDEPIDDVVGPASRIMLSDVVVDLFQVTLCILCQRNFVEHQGLSAFARRRSATSLIGVISPRSTCWLPRARIFKSASVSWVSS